MERFALSHIKPEVPKFILGRTVISQGAKALLNHDEVLAAFKRHTLGDWGDLGGEDKAANEAALKGEGRLLSRYTSVSGVPFYVITEADRSYTTILLPEEY